MAYQALYRKWRPSNFEEVKGQDHIVTTLKNQIEMNLTDIVNTVVGCRINLDHIHGSLLIDRTAHSTFIAGTAIDRMFAIHCLGKNLGNGSLTGSSCTAKQIGMPDTIHLYLIF